MQGFAKACALMFQILVETVLNFISTDPEVSFSHSSALPNVPRLRRDVGVRYLEGQSHSSSHPYTSQKHVAKKCTPKIEHDVWPNTSSCIRVG